MKNNKELTPMMEFCTCKSFEEMRLCKKVKDAFGCGLKDKPTTTLNTITK